MVIDYDGKILDALKVTVLVDGLGPAAQFLRK